MSRSDGPAAPSAITAERSALWALESFVTQTFAVAAAEVKKLRHDPLELFTRAVQPVLWLMLFGEVMARVRGWRPAIFPISISWPPAFWRRACCSWRSS